MTSNQIPSSAPQCYSPLTERGAVGPTEFHPHRSVGSPSPEQLRKQAVQQGRLADKAWASGATGKARGHIEKARKLTLLALQIEEQSK